MIRPDSRRFTPLPSHCAFHAPPKEPVSASESTRASPLVPPGPSGRRLGWDGSAARGGRQPARSARQRRAPTAQRAASHARPPRAIRRVPRTPAARNSPQSTQDAARSAGGTRGEALVLSDIRTAPIGCASSPAQCPRQRSLHPKSNIRPIESVFAIYDFSTIDRMIVRSKRSVALPSFHGKSPRIQSARAHRNSRCRAIPDILVLAPYTQFFVVVRVPDRGDRTYADCRPR